MIQEDGIDILLRHAGHMHNNYNNILNEKIALLVSLTRYPGTMGIPTIDYIFADQLLYQKNHAYL